MTPYYKDDLVAIYHADCRDLLPAMPSASVDMVFTDPPYGHNNNNGDLAHRREEALGIRKTTAADARPIANDGPEANALARWAFAQFNRLLARGGCCCCCCCGGGGPDPQFGRWSLWLDEAIGFKQAVVWDKGGLGMGWHYRRNYELVLVAQKRGGKCHWYGGHRVANVIRLPGIKPKPTDHPTPKPEKLPALFIGWHSLPGETVLDPFLGGGTTAVAAKKAGRRCVGVEIEERWCEMAARRVQACEPAELPPGGP